MAAHRIPHLTTYQKDLAERVLWTAAEGAAGVLAVAATHAPPAYAIPIATAVAILKGLIAKHLHSPSSASTVDLKA